MPSSLESRFFMATFLSNGTIIILTVTVVFNEIPFILVLGVRVKE